MSKCYWNNLDTICIVTQDKDKIKVSEIWKLSDGSWNISSKILTDEEFTIYTKDHWLISEYHQVQDHIFIKAFNPIYSEMILQFKLNGKISKIKLLEDMFTI